MIVIAERITRQGSECLLTYNLREQLEFTGSSVQRAGSDSSQITDGCKGSNYGCWPVLGNC